MAKLLVPVMGQRDSRWSNKILGTSNVTIGGYGCVITSMAMLCSYYGKSTDPAKLNDDTLRIKGFIDQNIYVWQSISQIYPDIKNTSILNYPTTPTPVNSINEQLDSGKPVVAWVDLNPNQAGADHFILLIGREGNDYWINDPWYGDQVMFSARYGDPVKMIFGHRLYTGSIPAQEPTLNPELTACLEAHKKLMDEIDKFLKPKIDDLEKELIEKNTTLDSLRKKYDQFIFDIAQQISKPENPLIVEEDAIKGAIEGLLKVEEQLKEKDRELIEIKQECKLKTDDLTNNHYVFVEAIKRRVIEVYNEPLDEDSAVLKALQILTDEIKDSREKIKKLEQEQMVIYKPLFFGLYYRVKKEGK